MLQEQVIPIDFGQGLDTKTDPKGVVAGKFLRLENGVFTAPKRIAKRNGYTATGTTIASVGTLSDPQMVHGYGNELIAADQGLLLSYSSNQDAWISKGSYTSAGLSRTLVSEDTATNGICDMAILGNYAVFAWGDLFGNVTASVKDLSTGAVLVTTEVYTAITSVNRAIKCVCLGGTTLAVIYYNESNEIKGKTVTFSGSGVVSFSAASTLASNATGVLDVVATSTGGAMVWINTGNDVNTTTISTALAVSTQTIATTTGDSAVCAVSTTSNGNIWSYWTESTTVGTDLTALSIYYAVYSSVLGVVLARTKILDTATPFYVSTMTAKSDSATQQTLYYGVFTTNNAGAAHMLEYSKYVTATSAGVAGSPALFANGVIPFSHPFTVGSKIYAVFIYRMSDITVIINGTLTDPVQSTFFIVELTNLISPPLVVARFAYGVANTDAGFNLVPLVVGNAASFSSTKFYFACGLNVQLTEASGAVGSFVNGNMGVFSYTFDFDSNDSYRAVNNSNVVLLSGACTQLYDGEICSEFNFHLSPEITDLTASNGSGSLSNNGVYSYIAIFQWIDAKGNLHQSAPSTAVVVTLGAADDTVTATMTVNFLSQKNNSFVALYRTINGGTVYYLVTGATFTTFANPTTSGGIATFIDTTSDTDLVKKQQAYTYPGSDVLENTTPPPSLVMTTHNNRLFFVDAENPDTSVWYTKSNQPLVGVSPSGFMTQEYDPKFGNIVALSEMDEKVVIFKQSGIMIQSGDGVTDAGNGSTFTFPQVVPSDVGCNYQKSVILTPEGIFFKSPNGIYMVNRSLNVGYLGAEVESYNSQDITGATLVPGKSQIRFLTSSGYTLVYDYIFKQWSTFTNHTGNSSTAWNSLYVYATTTGKVYKESSSSYLDGSTAYALLAQTSWLNLGSVQGFQRVRRLAMLGDFVNGASASHAMSISAAYDFSTTFQTPVPYSFGAISASGAFEYRERLPIQKCAAISLLIQETTTGDSAEYVDLTNISFEAGVKKGLNKLGAQYSVG
jgi:hypothetical protein